MKVSLFITCLVDQLWPEVGASAVEVLRRAGCEVVFDERQTCCGQPAFNTGYRGEARPLADRTYEFGSFLVNVLGVEDVGASFRGRVTWHDACHGLRDLNIRSEPRRLLRRVRGAEFVEMANADACCGFGGTFSVKYPEISVAILDQKIEAIERAGVQAVVSGDASCLMQIGGRLSRNRSKVQVMHLAELLAADERG